MAFAEVRSLKDHVGEEVTVRGWLYNKRKGGSIRFLLVRDGTGIVQESSLKVTGTVREDPRSPGGYELLVSRIEPVQIADPYPITPKEHGIEFLLDHRHLWLRSSRQHAILRVRHEVIRAIRNYYDSRGYVLIDSPIITLFATDYFGDTAYLTQSGQLYLEPACMSFGKVYCFGPTFRAEKSKTRRHLTEFWMVEPEVAWMEIDELMELCEDFVYEITARVLENCRSELETLERDIGKLEKALKRPYPRMTYTETIEKLQSAGSEIQWGNDFGAADETLLTRDLDQPLLVHRWPAAIKAFYMEPDPEDDRLILGVDVQAPEGYGELIGGSQRIGSPDKLVEKIKEHNLPEAAYRWYIEIRRFGGVPHSGFGLGVERTVTWLCGIRHIRETIPYPRTLNRLYP
jgi:asparaginyl-tRNA synthetase